MVAAAARSVHVMRARTIVLGCLSIAIVVTAGAAASAATHQVRLVPARSTYRAGQSIVVTVVNDSQTPIIHGFCFTLQRQVGRGWVTVTRTHGISLPCPPLVAAGVPQPVGTRAGVGLPLYDDLVPGEYRISLRYKPTHGVNPGGLSGPSVRVVRARLQILPFSTGPRPSLSEQRILALGEQVAARSGDPRPTLIQHAAGTHFEAVRISGGDLVFEWNWSYLIAVRGHFTATDAPIPPGAKPPTGTVITLVVDARSGRVTDFGISDRYPPLAELGPVTTDLGAPA